MKYKIRRVLFLMTFVALAVGVGLSWSKIPGLLDEITYKEGLRTLDDEPISTLDQVAQGRPIVIEVQYHTSCKYCIEEIEYLIELDLPEELVMVLLTNVKDSKARVRSFVKDHDLPDHWMIAIGGVPAAGGTPYTRIFIVTEAGWQVMEEKVGWDGGHIFAEIVAAIRERE